MKLAGRVHAAKLRLMQEIGPAQLRQLGQLQSDALAHVNVDLLRPGPIFSLHHLQAKLRPAIVTEPQCLLAWLYALSPTGTAASLPR